MLSFASSNRQWENGRAWAPLLLHCHCSSNLRCREVIELCGIQRSLCLVTILRLPAAKHLLSSCCVSHSGNSYLDKESKTKESHYHACLIILATPNKQAMEIRGYKVSLRSQASLCSWQRVIKQLVIYQGHDFLACMISQVILDRGRQ
jgi:hypothetical protein